MGHYWYDPVGLSTTIQMFLKEHLVTPIINPSLFLVQVRHLYFPCLRKNGVKELK